MVFYGIFSIIFITILLAMRFYMQNVDIEKNGYRIADLNHTKAVMCLTMIVLLLTLIFTTVPLLFVEGLASKELENLYPLYLPLFLICYLLFHTFYSIFLGTPRVFGYKVIEITAAFFPKKTLNIFGFNFTHSLFEELYKEASGLYQGTEYLIRNVRGQKQIKTFLKNAFSTVFKSHSFKFEATDKFIDEVINHCLYAKSTNLNDPSYPVNLVLDEQRCITHVLLNKDGVLVHEIPFGIRFVKTIKENGLGIYQMSDEVDVTKYMIELRKNKIWK